MQGTEKAFLWKWINIKEIDEFYQNYSVENVGKMIHYRDYKMIKKSFKLKDRTTNPTVIYILIAIVGIGIRCFISYRKNNRKIQSYTNNNEIDYKNMTEEDFKRIDELNKY